MASYWHRGLKVSNCCPVCECDPCDCDDTENHDYDEEEEYWRAWGDI